MSVLIWKTKNEEKSIKDLEDLLEVLNNITIENVDEEIKVNKDALINWLNENYSKKIGLLTSLKNAEMEFTPQQFREELVRALRNIT
jgi:hypothetical protein